MKPKLEILPQAQVKLWPLLSSIPSCFTLYGGTAVALQLAHRESVDFDFFSAGPLNKNKLLEVVSFLNQAQVVQPEINTLNCHVEMPDGFVKLQFLAGLHERQGRVEDPLICEGNGIHIASLRDLLATKLNTIQMRAEIKDYVDIYAMLRHGLTLEDGLACATAIYGKQFDSATSLRALCSYRDGDLPQLSKDVKDKLVEKAVNVENIPTVVAKSPTIAFQC